MEAEERVVAPPWGPDNEVYREHIARYEFAAPLVKGLRVLDVACGSGFGSQYLANYGAEVIGVDLSADAIVFAQKHYNAFNLSFKQEDGANLSFADRDFDAVVSFETIEHLPDQEAFLKGIRRVLKAGGFLIASTPDREVIPKFFFDPAKYRNPFHLRELSRNELAKLLSKYFSIVQWYGQGLFEQRQEPSAAVKFAKSFFTWLPEPIRLKLKSHITGVNTGYNIFELGDKKAKYLVAICKN